MEETVAPEHAGHEHPGHGHAGHEHPGHERAGHDVDGSDRQGHRPLRTLVLAVLAVPALAVLAFVVLGLMAGPPQTTLLASPVAPWRTTLGDAASAVGFAVTVAGLVMMVRAGQVGGARRPRSAELLDTLDGAQRRAAARAVAGHEATSEEAADAARALALVRAARWTVMVLFAGLLLTTLGRAVVALDAGALVGPLAVAAVLAVLLVVLVRQARQARTHLLHHPDRRTPPAVLDALAPWTAQPGPAGGSGDAQDPTGAGALTAGARARDHR